MNRFFWYLLGIIIASDLLKMSAPYDPAALVLGGKLALWFLWGVCILSLLRFYKVKVQVKTTVEYE